jgi:hypothetical protein
MVGNDTEVGIQGFAAEKMIDDVHAYYVVTDD